MPPLYWGSAAAFVAWAGMAYMGTKFFHLEGTSAYLFVGALSALGISLWSVFYFYQKKISDKIQGTSAAGMLPGGAAGGTPMAGGAEGGAPELDQLLRDANARFSQSSVGQGQTIANLPLIFVVGDRGTSKTTSIMQSGIVPELLSGQVYQQSNDVVPTRTGNVWFARGFAFVEAGGSVIGDPASWTRLVKGLQPGKIKSLVGKGGQAPRGVLLCVNLESFLSPGASGALEAASRYLSARLGEISQILGISFPVFVLFTKADRVPFFTDYVRTLSNDEAGQVLGATLPMRDVHSGVYAEEETRRLTEAFNQLFYSLCDNRVVYMPREDDQAVLPGAYEFPREFRKLRGPMVQFLVDICRPSQLRVSPFLRGFYFAGARPVVVGDVNVSRAAEQPRQQAEEFGGATSMFRAGMKEEMLSKMSVAQSQPNARKVPQWVFLTHLFHGLIMQDSAAMGASGASVGTSLLRRVLFGCATALFLLVATVFTLSYFGNRALEQEALTAARNITGSDSSEPVLRRLDTLRLSLEKLTNYEHNGHPFTLGFGLYAGSKILPDVRQVYYNKFKQVLFGETQTGMLAFMRTAPPAPGPSDDYGNAYSTLKSYLLTASEYKRTADRNLQTFLGESLNARWRRGKEDVLTKERGDLAKAQFDFYSRDLHNGNPYSSQGETPAIERTRLYLSKFSGIERVYQALLTEVNKGHTSESFNDHFKGTAAVVTSAHPVAFAYTKPGADLMLKAVHEQKFGGEPWVLGNYQTQTVDKVDMEKGVLNLYGRDFIKQWRTVIQTSKVNSYANLNDAAAKLTTLSGNEAPLLALFWWTSLNTNIDIPDVVTAFQSVRQVVPPSTEPRYVVNANQNYNNGLMKLQGTIAQAAGMPTGPDPAVAAATQADAANAKLSTRQLTSTFPVDSETHLEAKVNDLMLEPITNAEALAKGMGVAEINGKGRALCSALNLITNKFPFNPTSDPEVSLEELSSVFKAKDGKLWQFYETGLKNFVACNGSDCTPIPNAPGQVEPRFLYFFKQAVAFSKALYGEAGTDPNFRYTLRPIKSELIDEFDLTVNGDTAHLNGGGQRTYAWPGPGTPGFHLDLKLTGGGNPLGGEPYTGLWAVFRFFADADTTTRSGVGYEFRWNPRQGKRGTAVTTNGKPLTYEFFVDTNGAPAVFSKDFLAGLKCTPTVAH
jgi:type VI secretion system protein ImpL